MTKPVQPIIGERFIILCGTSIEPWVYTDEPFKMDHAAAVDLIASGEALDFVQAIAFDISRGTCRDATDEIAREVMTRWAENDEPISYRQREFLELHISIQAANSFAQAAE